MKEDRGELGGWPLSQLQRRGGNKRDKLEIYTGASYTCWYIHIYIFSCIYIYLSIYIDVHDVHGVWGLSRRTELEA